MNKKVWDISKLSSAEKSVLKRCAGQMMGNDMRAMQAYYHAVGYQSHKNEKEYYAALCMECLWRDSEELEKVPFEMILHDMYFDEHITESMKHKLVSFLDLPWGNDGFLLGKLCSLAKIMKTGNLSKMPDFLKLAEDLSFWNADGKQVQRRWLKTICMKHGNKCASREEEKNVD